jgi:hypothetical protein
MQPSAPPSVWLAPWVSANSDPAQPTGRLRAMATTASTKKAERIFD